jgi:hypothetical protein
LPSIEPGDFRGLASLTELNLGDNRISRIRAVDFSGLPWLRTTMAHVAAESLRRYTSKGRDVNLSALERRRRS